MAYQAVILIFISAAVHTLWNAVSKKNDADAVFFGLGTGFASIFLFPFIIIYRDIFTYLSWAGWGLLLASAFSQGVYFIFLGKAYATGNLSVVYPIARSAPIIIVTILMVTKGIVPAWQGFVGISLAVLGCFLVPLKKLTEIKFADYLKMYSLFALLAACMTASYSILDKINTEAFLEINRNNNLGHSSILLSLMYNSCITFTLSFFLFAVGFISKGREVVFQSIRKQWKASILVGSCSFGGYGMVLVAMRYVENVSYVVAFRQVSILMTVCTGIVFLKEKAYLPKIAGTLIIVAGLILIGLYGK